MNGDITVHADITLHKHDSVRERNPTRLSISKSCISFIFSSSKTAFEILFQNNSGDTRCGGAASFCTILYPLVLLSVLVGVHYISTITSTCSS